jgi:predicted nuclease of predicted toxin-antitoxin system
MVARGPETRRVARASGRLLVIDESLDKRLADQLEQRGRSARSADWLGLVGLKDEPLLRALAALPEAADLILVTGDDDMPGEHGSLVKALRITVATIDGRRAVEWPREEWKKEIVHRWAHAMQLQRPATSERYSLTRHGRWTRRRGHR